MICFLNSDRTISDFFSPVIYFKSQTKSNYQIAIKSSWKFTTFYLSFNKKWEKLSLIISFWVINQWGDKKLIYTAYILSIDFV